MMVYFAQAHRNHFEFQPGTMTGLDRQRRVILLDDMHDPGGDVVVEARELPYDYLVMATGSQSNDFGTPGAAAFTTPLDTRQQAERFHRTLLNHYYRAKARGDSETLSIAIVGAGATGVELSAEVHHAAEILTRYGLDEIEPANVVITLIEAAPRVLPALDKRISAAAHRELSRINVRVLVNQRVSAVNADGITTEDGTVIPAQIRVWAAGVKAPELLVNLDGLRNGKNNTLWVDSHLRTDDPRIFAMGDCAWCVETLADGSERVVPPRAQSAFLQAKWLTRHFSDLMLGHQVPPFQYKDYGSLISLSETRAVGKVMGNLTGKINVEGRIARIMYLSLYRRHQAVLYGWTRTLVFLIKDLLVRNSGPRLKMH